MWPQVQGALMHTDKIKNARITTVFRIKMLRTFKKSLQMHNTFIFETWAHLLSLVMFA